MVYFVKIIEHGLLHMMSKAHKILSKEIKAENYVQALAREFYDKAQEKNHNTKIYKTAITDVISEYPNDDRDANQDNLPCNDASHTASCVSKNDCFMKLLTNIDYEGLYFPITENDLSPTYAEAIKNTKTGNSLNIKSSEYNLNNISHWKLMKEFSSFRSMKKVICDNLAFLNIPPQDLPKLNYADIFDIIKKHNIRHPERAMPSRRTKFLKMFAACYGEDFVRIESYFGHKKEALDFLAYTTYLGTTQKAPLEIKESAERYNVHHGKFRKNAKSNSNDHLTLCNKELHAMIHYLKKNIDSKIVYFGTFSNYFHIYRDFEKERLYFQGIIPEYRIPDKDVYEHSYRKKSEKHPSKDNKHKNKNKNKNNTHKRPPETTARIASKHRGGGYKR